MPFGTLPTAHLGRSEPSVGTHCTHPFGSDLLTVFQGAPLIHVDHTGRNHPVGLLDFEEERQILTESLSDAHIKIDVVFDVANSDRLGAFLAKGEGRVLHFSCHGHPQYLAIENCGAMQQLLVDDLRDWIQAGGQNLQFVFVSACYSRQAGEAFVEAGVPHVVCCQQDDQQIRNAAAVEFARAFYRALACGKLLSEAFELGRQQVLNSLQIDRSERRKEVAKFTLLPEKGTDHNVPIFRQTLRTISSSSSSSRSMELDRSMSLDWSERHDRSLPVPPHVFEGRQVDMYRVLEALQSSRLVRVTGPKGIGKCSVVQGLCRYMRDRRHPFSREILWLPSPRAATEAGESTDNTLYHLQSEMGALFSVNETPDYKRTQQRVLTYLHTKRALVVIDVRRIKDRQPMSRVCSFLEEMVHCTVYAKAVLIHHIGDAVAIPRLNCKESNVYIKELDFENTVLLFGKLCQHVTGRRYVAVSSAHELCDLLIPEGTHADKPMSKKSRDIFRMIGEGVPSLIHKAAKSMSESEFDRLVAIASRKEHQLEFKSRAALDKRLSEITAEIDGAIMSKNFMQAQEFQEQLDEMELLRETLPDLETLTSLGDGLRVDQELSIQARDFIAAAQLQEELDALESKIATEKQAMFELGMKPDADRKVTRKAPATRSSLDARIAELETQLQDACDQNNFRRARSIDAQMIDLRAQKENLPSREVLLLRVAELREELKAAKEDRDWDKAESVYATLQTAEAHLEAESEGEATSESTEKRESKLMPDAPGAVAVGGLPNTKGAGADPDGDLSFAMDETDCDVEMGSMSSSVSSLPVALAVIEEQEQSNKDALAPPESEESIARDSMPVHGLVRDEIARESPAESLPSRNQNQRRGRVPIMLRRAQVSRRQAESAPHPATEEVGARTRSRPSERRRRQPPVERHEHLLFQHMEEGGGGPDFSSGQPISSAIFVDFENPQRPLERARLHSDYSDLHSQVAGDFFGNDVEELSSRMDDREEDANDATPSRGIVEAQANAAVLGGDFFGSMPLALSSEGMLSNRMMLEQMVQETISNMTVPATKVEIEEEPAKKSKSRKKIKSFFRRKKGG